MSERDEFLAQMHEIRKTLDALIFDIDRESVTEARSVIDVCADIQSQCIELLSIKRDEQDGDA